jgi:hypothetical protein
MMPRRQVAVLVNEKEAERVHDVTFDGTGFSGSVCFYRLKSECFVLARRLALLE